MSRAVVKVNHKEHSTRGTGLFCLIGVMFLVLSFALRAQRPVWLGVAVAFLVLGMRRRKNTGPPPGAPRD